MKTSSRIETRDDDELSEYGTNHHHAPAPEFSLKYIKTEEGKALPVLATFAQNIPSKKDDLSFELLKKRKVDTISGQKYGISMSGKYRENTASSKYILGFVDDTTQKIDFVDVDGCFQIDRFLENDKISELVGVNTDAEGLEHREMIVAEIGTKKGKKILQQMKNKVIKEDAIFSAPQIKELMHQKAEEIQHDIDVNSSSFFQKELERKKEFLPEFNLSAKSAAKIYSVDSLMPQRLHSCLHPTLLKNPRFLIPFAKTLESSISWSSMTEEQSNHKKKLLIYVNCLLQFNKIRKIDVSAEEIAKNQHIPVEVAKHLVDSFYDAVKKKSGQNSGQENEGRAGVDFIRSKKQDLKLLCYIIIGCLMLSNFKLVLNPLMSTLRVDENQMQLACRELGCSINKNKEGQLVGKLKKLVVESVDRFEKSKK